MVTVQLSCFFLSRVSSQGIQLYASLQVQPLGLCQQVFQLEEQKACPVFRGTYSRVPLRREAREVFHKAQPAEHPWQPLLGHRQRGLELRCILLEGEWDGKHPQHRQPSAEKDRAEAKECGGPLDQGTALSSLQSQEDKAMAVPTFLPSCLISSWEG